MAKIEFVGIDKYFDQLEKLGNRVTGLCKRALYDGAGVVADEVRSEVTGLPTTDRNGSPDKVLEYEKAGLLAGLGIASMKVNTNGVSTRVDFDGYNRLKSKSYPGGHPNSMVARAINSGTSRRTKNPFMARAVRKARSKAEDAMSARFDADTKKIVK